jgi:hypothetical protein
MIQAAPEQIDDVVIVQGIENLTSFASPADEAEVAQGSKLVRHG